MILSTLLALEAQAEKDFSSWRKFTSGQWLLETDSVAPGSVATLGFRIKLEPHWHTYWVNPGDSGAAIHLEFQTPASVKIREVLHPIPQRIETGTLISFAYEDEVVLPVEIEISADQPVNQILPLKINAEWLVCKEVCIPAIESFDVNLSVRTLAEVKPSPDSQSFKKARAEVPKPLDFGGEVQFSETHAELKLPDIPQGFTVADFFPFKGSGLSNAKPELNNNILRFALSKTPRATERRVGILVLQQIKGPTRQAWQFGNSGWMPQMQEGGASTPSQSSPKVWWILFSAFLGGLILNLMPCVFPILSIKLFSLLKLSDSQLSQVRKQNLAYVLGVIFSFLFLAVLLAALRSAGQAVGWGFQLQSPVFLSLLVWLFFVLSLNLLGIFEIEFLDSGFGHQLTRLGGFWGSFFTGVLAVVVASPCTAPYMGVALGFGLTQSVWILLLVFFLLGLGLAFPYLIFIVFPHWIRVLPRPGKWMEVVKQLMAFPLLFTVLWLVWILNGVGGIQSVMVALVIMVLLGACVWLRSLSKKWAAVFTLLTIIFGVYLSYQLANTGMADVLASQQNKPIDESGYQPFSYVELEKLKNQNVFINMTADWCLTCKVNEHVVFSDSQVLEAFKRHKVQRLKGDWTRRDENITRFLSSFERVGVPFYVLYSPKYPNGKVLPEVLSVSAFIEAMDHSFTN